MNWAPVGGGNTGSRGDWNDQETGHPSPTRARTLELRARAHHACTRCCAKNGDRYFRSLLTKTAKIFRLFRPIVVCFVHTHRAHRMLTRFIIETSSSGRNHGEMHASTNPAVGSKRPSTGFIVLIRIIRMLTYVHKNATLHRRIVNISPVHLPEAEKQTAGLFIQNAFTSKPGIRVSPYFNY